MKFTHRQLAKPTPMSRFALACVSRFVRASLSPRKQLGCRKILRQDSRVARLAVGLLGVLCLLAAAAAEGGRWSPRLDLLANAAPLFMAGSLVTLVCGLIGRRGRLLISLLGVGGLVAGAPLILPEFVRPIPSPPAAPNAVRLTLIELNAWGANPTPALAAAWLASRKPDVIVIEDVGPLLATDLLDRGYQFTRGIDGTAIFSRRVPAPAALKVPPPLWPLLPSFARATFESQGRSFSVVGVHLRRPYDQGAVGGTAAFASLIAGLDHRRLIVAGDFNLTPWTFALRRLDGELALERRDRAMFSWPAVIPHGAGMIAPAPFLPIDHIYAGSAWRTESIELGPNLGSDHYPVIATLALEA
jgi:endonuclease/exonuclease/phosphatase (EEP) superfamily protein YafD